MTDDAIPQAIERAKRGDKEAFVFLYRTYYDLVYTYVYHRTYQRELAEDLTSDVFCLMVDKIHTFQFREKPFLAWLYTIAHHRLVDFLRKEKHHSFHDSADIDHFDGRESHPETTLERQLDLDCLYRVLPRLTTEQQQVIVLKFFQGLENEQLAKRIQKPIGAVKSLQHRALRSLRRLMEQESCL